MAETAVPEHRPRFRRRNFLLRPGYQLQVAAAILLFILAYSLLLGFLIFYPLHQAFMGTADSEEQLWIAREVIDLHKRFWPSVLVVGILVAIQSIFMTHRVVGPAYHVQRVLEEFATGNFALRVHLRRGDRLKEVEAAVNTLGEAMLRRAQAQQLRAERLRAAAAEFRSGMGGAVLPESVQRTVAEMERGAIELSGAA